MHHLLVGGHGEVGLGGKGVAGLDRLRGRHDGGEVVVVGHAGRY